MTLAPASRLGPYEIVQLLSSGSMGEIYRARDTRLGREVAVKVLAPQLAADPDRLARFEQEARAASLLNHPNIVAVHDIGAQDGTWFVVSELIAGTTLRAVLADGPVPRDRALGWAAQVARGLAAAHARGVVHRDLKPENVMLTPDGLIKIVDFGIAKVRSPALLEEPGETRQPGGRTLPGTLIGTIAYMSPEQVRGETVDHRADIFSLGVVLYELLEGRHPFMRRTAAETMSAILRDDPPPVSADQAVIALVRRAIEKPRDKRFAAALEFAEAIDGAGRASAMVLAGAISQPAPRTVVVLPFANMNPGGEADYFSDGLTEELIHALTRVRGLQVVAWHSASQLRGDERETRTALEQMNVQTVLTGSVRRAAGRVRIAARLVNVATGFYLWSESYDRRLEDAIAIQEEIAAAIATRLTAALAPAAHERGRTHDVEAYHHYLRGRFFWNKRTTEGLLHSVECFERALRLDDRFALAHAGLADAYCLLADYGVVHPNEAMPRARSAAIRALELDPYSAEAHASFGYIRGIYDWEWLEAEALYRRAIELNPGYATAHHWLAIDLLATLARFDEAEHELEIAARLDPLSLIIQEGRGYLPMLARRYDEAVATYRGVLELEPGFYKLHTSLGRALAQRGEYDEAVRMLEAGRAMAGDLPSILGALGQIHAQAGRRDEARGLLARLEKLQGERHVSSTSFAVIHAGLGERDKALEWLERGCSQHELSLPSIGVHPAYDVLRDDSRFTALLRRMRLDEIGPVEGQRRRATERTPAVRE